jgi:ornithine cyclodeaminase/alanine dehydrogenase-like protein (mu-crystallin family)
MALILSRTDIQRCLTMPEAIEAMRVAFTALQTGRVQIPQRLAVDLPEQGVALLMPSLLETAADSAFALKVVTVTPQNPRHGLPRLFASILLLDATTGQTLAVMEGGWLTAFRTGAASGLATDLLARRNADVLALFGAGVQAPMQVLAIHAVRPLREVRVVNRSDEHYQFLAATLQLQLGPDCPPIQRAANSEEALVGASIVACATTATAPLFAWNEVATGTHINAIGAFTPDMCEIDPYTLAHARIFVDQRQAALAEAGDLLQAQAARAIGDAEAWTELGELLAGVRPGRQAAYEVTVFKSVGVAAQDVAVALRVYQNARALGVGIEVEL